MTYIAYLDEFGHIGPYTSNNHEKHNTHSVFGLIGRMAHYQVESDVKSEFEWVDKYFKARIQQAQKRSSVREFKKTTAQDLQRHLNNPSH